MAARAALALRIAEQRALVEVASTVARLLPYKA